MSSRPANASLLEFYRSAKSWVERSGFAGELNWQANLDHAYFSESDFLREYAWVVLNSGFRESVVRKYFDYISLCYCDWQSAREIDELADVCNNAASAVFGNMPKLRAITHTAGLVNRIGFESLKGSLHEDFFNVALTLPFIGPVTARHLGKNLGLNTAKPDRHLVRLARQFGYFSVDEMCLTIARVTGDSLSVADLVLWRFEERSKAKALEPVDSTRRRHHEQTHSNHNTRRFLQ
jgi:hypothetical protein